MAPDDNTFTIRLECNAFVNAPIWENHKRGKNWCAIIAIDPSAPGGLARTFLTRAHGDYLYLLPPDLAVHTPLEFGADYYSTLGNPSRQRWYGVVRSITPSKLTLEQYGSARNAIKAAKQLQQTTPKDNPYMVSPRQPRSIFLSS